MANNILHLVPADYFHSFPASEPYFPEAFTADGFIHCTKEPEVMLKIANRFYKDLPGELLVLVIDADKVAAEVKWEAPAHPDGSAASAGEPLFPHIYGPLNRNAIVEIHPAVRAKDGTFLAV
ncbi:MAG: DUF952 domain-containing protein [Chloroflexi bacterium]|nr:DUF952 domain-containing protein [Chloroflexota bacterium]